MAVAGLPKLDDIKNAVTKAKEALSKYNTGKGSLKTLEEGIAKLKSIQEEESKKLTGLRSDHESKKYLDVDSYKTLKDKHNKSLEEYNKLKSNLDSRSFLDSNSGYKDAKKKYDDVYAIINSNR